MVKKIGIHGCDCLANKRIIAWPKGEVNAQEEDEVLGRVDVHHLCNERMMYENLMPNTGGLNKTQKIMSKSRVLRSKDHQESRQLAKVPSWSRERRRPLHGRRRQTSSHAASTRPRPRRWQATRRKSDKNLI